MTRDEAKTYCLDNGVPLSRSTEKLRVMDLTVLPGGLRSHFDDRGFFIEPVIEAPVQEVTGEAAPVSKRGKR